MSSFQMVGIFWKPFLILPILNLTKTSNFIMVGCSLVLPFKNQASTIQKSDMSDFQIPTVLCSQLALYLP